jgi:predicted Fe-S protein YdhL (DUF1289 family)
MTDMLTGFRDLFYQELQYDAAEHSPCVGICDHVPLKDCSGCQRRHEDIQVWREAEPQMRVSSWERLPRVLADQGKQVMRLPLGQEQIIRLAMARLDHGGCWRIGVEGCWLQANQKKDDISAISTDGKTHLRLETHIKMRALLWAAPGQRLDDDPAQLALLLVTPRIRIERGEGQHQQPLPIGYRSHIKTDTIRISTSDHGRLRAETVIANGETEAPLPQLTQKASNLPHGLSLPDSYVLGLTILPPQ